MLTKSKHVLDISVMEKYYDHTFTEVEIDSALKLIELSFNAERERYGSLVSTSGRILTADSIIIVATSTLFRLYLDVFGSTESFNNIIRSVPLWASIKTCINLYIVILVLLLVSLLLTLFAQYRFGYLGIAGPIDILDNMVMNDGAIEEDKTKAKLHYIFTIAPTYYSLRERNDTLRNLLRAATVFAGSGLLVGVVVGLRALLSL